MLKNSGPVVVLAISALLGAAFVSCDDDGDAGTGGDAAAGSGGVGNTAGIGGTGTGGTTASDAGTVDSSASSDGAAPGPVSKLISAAAGGVVVAGGASIDFPPGALATDTTITVAVLTAAGQPDAANLLSPIYDLGPNGITFLKPVKLTFGFDAVKVTAGKTAAIAFLQGSAWTKLGDSASAANKMTATTTHFTPFTVLLGGSVATGDCKFKGNYALDTYACGPTDITTPWKAAVTSTTLVVSDKSGGGCTFVMTFTSNSCTESEGFEATAPVGDVYQWVNKGVLSCNPAACKLNTNDSACLVGDRAASAVAATVKTEGAKVRVVLPSKGSGLCGTNESIVVFAPQ